MDDHEFEQSAKDCLNKKFLLSFPKPLERQYIQDNFQERVNHLLTFTFLGILIFFVYLFVDYQMLEENYQQSVFIRVVFSVIPVIFLMPILHFNRKSLLTRYIDFIVIILGISSAMIVLYIENLSTPANIPIYSTGTMIITLFFNVVLQQQFRHACFCSLTILIIFLINRFMVIDVKDPHFLISCLDHIVVTSISLVARYLIDFNHRRSYLNFLLAGYKAKSLEKLATTDPLTGLFNRRFFQEQAALMFEQAKRKNTNVALLFIDVDFFKLYNDNYGHKAGDECLVNISDVISQSVRDSDVLARYGGEEFVIILDNTSKQTAIAFASRLNQMILDRKLEHKYSKIADFVTVSIGICDNVDTSISNLDELIRRADIALYQAKDKGRNRSELYCL